MEKLRLHFDVDDWLAEDIENHKKQHPELEFTKDVLQNYISSLKEQVKGLEAQVRYLNDTAEKSDAATDAPLGNQDSPPNSHSEPLQTEKPRSTQEPQVLGPSSDLHMLKIGNKTYRISDTQIAKSVWKDGETTFSRKQAEALAFAEALLTIRQQKAAQMEDKKQETDHVHTQEHQKRADITVDMHRQIVQYHKRPRPIIQEEGQRYLFSPCPLGHSPSHCIANPCDNRASCNKEGRINNAALKYDHGDLSEQYIR